MMEELTASLASSFQVSVTPNNIAAPHPRFAEYKAKPSKSDQIERRKQLLQQQKNKRKDFADYARRLAENDWSGVDPESEEEDSPKPMDTHVRTSHKKHRRPRHYKNQLMVSEWLVDVPSDLESHWFMVLCPVGKRCLVVTAHNTTACYTRNGYCLNRFPSHLPNGSRKSHELHTRNGHTILDCVYNEEQQTFYILDIMCWNGHPVYDSDTEFRFYWLEQKTLEIPTLRGHYKANPYKFVTARRCVCTPSLMEQMIAARTLFEIDGVLFYHKQTCYTFGATPLVGWLKPYMFPEMLNIPVPEEILLTRPQNYTTMVEDIAKYEETRAKLRESPIHRKSNNPFHTRPSHGRSDMDTTPEQSSVQSTDGDNG